MKITIPGGTGQVGTLLARAFVRDGHDVVVLGRTLKPAPWRVVKWDPNPGAAWTAELDDTDVVINLIGRTVNCRYTPAHRKEILESRIESVRAVAQAIAQAKRSPAIWLQASTATIYAHAYDVPNDEFTGVLGGNEPGVPETWRFSIQVATAWEKAIDDAAVPGTRKVKLRSAMVMSPDADGIFDTLLTLVRRGLGGTSADGRQFVSWIHEIDFVRAIQFIIDRGLDGVMNLAAPHPLSNREFMAILRQEWGTRLGLPAAKWMLEWGAFFLRTESELILKSRKVVPGRLLRDGFQFQYPQWAAAAHDLCVRAKSA